eukprot:176481-Prymnesium_polylepis.1
MTKRGAPAAAAACKSCCSCSAGVVAAADVLVMNNSSSVTVTVGTARKPAGEIIFGMPESSKATCPYPTVQLIQDEDHIVSWGGRDSSEIFRRTLHL